MGGGGGKSGVGMIKTNTVRKATSICEVCSYKKVPLQIVHELAFHSHIVIFQQIIYEDFDVTKTNK